MIKSNPKILIMQLEGKPANSITMHSLIIAMATVGEIIAAIIQMLDLELSLITLRRNFLYLKFSLKIYFLIIIEDLLAIIVNLSLFI